MSGSFSPRATLGRDKEGGSPIHPRVDACPCLCAFASIQDRNPAAEGGEGDWSHLVAGPDPSYELTDIDASELEPLVACPSSPHDVAPV